MLIPAGIHSNIRSLLPQKSATRTGAGSDLVRVSIDGTGPQSTFVHDFELLSDHLSVDVHHVTGYSLQNSHTIDGVSGRFIDPGLATISFDDGSIVTLNVLAAQGYQGQGIYDWSIFA